MKLRPETVEDYAAITELYERSVRGYATRADLPDTTIDATADSIMACEYGFSDVDGRQP